MRDINIDECIIQTTNARTETKVGFFVSSDSENDSNLRVIQKVLALIKAMRKSYHIIIVPLKHVIIAVTIRSLYAGFRRKCLNKFVLAGTI